jgi:uncharacterized membrane protein YhdT
MKLNLVSARTGILWVKLGIQTFFKQPIALTGLFFMYMAVISIASLIPLLGSALALGLLPAATLGLMAASREATKGNFPMPSVLVSAFRAGRQRMRAMLVLGLLYAMGFLFIMGISAIFDGGQFARLYLVGGKITREMVNSGEFQSAMWVSVLLYLPLSLLFWHAPALVHWHGEPPVKSLFFSLIACWRNKWALTLYGVTWLALFIVVGFVISLTAGLMSSPEVGALIMMPTALLMAAMFFTSIYFTFRDSFVAADGEDA